MRSIRSNNIASWIVNWPRVLPPGSDDSELDEDEDPGCLELIICFASVYSLPCEYRKCASKLDVFPFLAATFPSHVRQTVSFIGSPLFGFSTPK